MAKTARFSLVAALLGLVLLLGAGLVPQGADAVQHGRTTLVALANGASCATDNTLSPGSVVGGSLTGIISTTWQTTSTHYVFLPCGSSPEVGDLLLSYKPEKTGKYKLTMSSAETFVTFGIVHCNDGQMYSSGFKDIVNEYNAVCATSTGSGLDAYLFGGSQYYIAVTYGSPAPLASDFAFTLTATLSEEISVDASVDVFSEADARNNIPGGLSPLAIFGISIGAMFGFLLCMGLLCGCTGLCVLRNADGTPRTSKGSVFTVASTVNPGFQSTANVTLGPSPWATSAPLGTVDAPTQKLDRTKATIMISYEWSSQPTAFRVRDMLLAEDKYNVIIDRDGIHGNFLTWMNWAVSNSHAVLILVNSKYNKSVNCEREACRAADLKKTVVPIVLEQGFKPQDWLAMVMSGRIYYEALTTEALDENMRVIIDRELQFVLETDV